MKQTIKLLFLVLFFLSTGCAANRLIYPAHPTPQEVHFIETQDEWSLAVYHYPAVPPAKDKPPVILCHGLNQNYLTWDLTPQCSLARTLAQNGYDVWSLSLRGAGKSTKPGWVQFLELSQPQLSVLQAPQYDYRKFDWNFDDIINEDVPAVIQFVQEKTKKKELTWIGHSLGGMVLYAYLGKGNTPAIKNAIFISTPAKVPHPPSALVSLIETQPKLMHLNMLLNTKNVSVFTAPFSPQWNHPLQHLWYNPENMTNEIQTRFHAQVVENTTPGVVAQLQLMVRQSEFYSADGKLNYTSTIPKLKAHLLCVAGKADNLASPAAVLPLYLAAQSPDKTYRLFGIANGYQVDYGHNDLLLGKHAPNEVYPYILNWLNQH